MDKNGKSRLTAVKKLLFRTGAVALLMLLTAAAIFCMYYLHRTDEDSMSGVDCDALVWQCPEEGREDWENVICAFPADAAWIEEKGAECPYLMIGTDAEHAGELAELMEDAEGEILYIPLDAAAADALDELGMPRCACADERTSFYLDMLSYTAPRKYPFACVICPFGSAGKDGMINYGTDSFVQNAAECDVQIVFETGGADNIRYVLGLGCAGVITPSGDAETALQVIDE